MMKANLSGNIFKHSIFKASTFKHSIFKGKTLTILALICNLTLVSTAQAAKTDLEQEITIKSQRQAADLKNKIASYLDNVSIRQGSITITADIVKVFSQIDKNSGEKKDTYLAKGKPAMFEQKLEDGSLIKLQADEITYSPNANMITVKGNALVKQAGSEVSGNEITYNLSSEKLEASSVDNQPVTTILQPTILKKQKETNEKSKVDKAMKQVTDDINDKVSDVVTDEVVEKPTDTKGDSIDN